MRCVPTTSHIMPHLSTHPMHTIFFQRTFLKSSRRMCDLLENCSFKAEEQTDRVWRQHAQLLLSRVIEPRSPSIVWEIPRVQRVSYVLLINAGTSLQQIHKLSKCDLAFSLFPGISSQNVELTPLSLQDPRKFTRFKSLAKLVISRSVLSKYFYFFERCCTWFRSQM